MIILLWNDYSIFTVKDGELSIECEIFSGSAKVTQTTTNLYGSCTIEYIDDEQNCKTITYPKNG